MDIGYSSKILERKKKSFGLSSYYVLLLQSVVMFLLDIYLKVLFLVILSLIAPIQILVIYIYVKHVIVINHLPTNLVAIMKRRSHNIGGSWVCHCLKPFTCRL